MIFDVVAVWPRNNDYPLWREFIRDNRTKFNEILITFMETNQGYDYRSDVINHMFPDYAHFISAQQVHATEDWRNVAINAALLHSYNAPWIWFTEQDFFPTAGFWEDVKKLEDDGCGVIAVYQGARMHPCCIFMRRDVLNRTCKNFSIVPDKSDHFSLIQRDIEQMHDIKQGKINPDTYKHLNGLSHNWSLLANGQEPNHNVDEFFDYLLACMSVDVPLSPEWTTTADAGIKRHLNPQR